MLFFIFAISGIQQFNAFRADAVTKIRFGIIGDTRSGIAAHALELPVKKNHTAVIVGGKNNNRHLFYSPLEGIPGYLQSFFGRLSFFCFPTQTFFSFANALIQFLNGAWHSDLHKGLLTIAKTGL